jgi:hypothetical protein
LRIRVCPWLFTAILLQPSPLSAESIPVRYPEGVTHRFLALGADPKPRLVHLSITPDGEETFSVAGARHKATFYKVKVEIGGIAGMIAPPIGKQPAEAKVWVVGEGAPAFVRADEALYVGGPIWGIQMTGPEWGGAAHSGR